MSAEFKSAAENLGPHLLGRIESPPDSRDLKLRNYLHTGAPTLTPTDIQALLDNAVQHLKSTTVGWLVAPGKPHSASWQNNKTTEWNKGLDGIAQARAALGGTPTPPAPSGDKVYTDNEAVLDQGNYGTCVGNGVAQFLNTDPIDDKYTEGFGAQATAGGPYARALYYEATVFDGQPDNPDAAGGGQQGASVRSGMKALQKRGRIAAYASAATVDEIRTWLQTGKGTVVAGTDWTNAMFNPDSNGYIKPTGGVAGGHCYLIVGDLVSEGALLFQNSWGAGWGQKGRFKMKYADFQTLLDQGGEAWAAVELALA